MCTKSVSTPTITMRKKQVSFFERVRIREIRVDDWSETDDDEFLDPEFEYQMDLEQDLGDYQEALVTEGRHSLTYSRKGKGKSNNKHKISSSTGNHILDFSGKIYSSSFHDPQTDRIPSKFLLLPSLKADRWKSQTTPSLNEAEGPEAEGDRPPHMCGSGSQFDSMEFHKEKLSRIKEDCPFTSVPSLPCRTSSTESLTRMVSKPLLPPSGSSSDSLRNWKRITSAPSLMRRKSKSKNNSAPSIAESRNATFGSPTPSKNNRPPLLPTRWNSRKNIFLMTSSDKHLSNKSMGRFSDSSFSSHTAPESEDEYQEQQQHLPPPPPPPTIPESPKNRRNLLQRGMGSLRSLTKKSPKTSSRKTGMMKGRNDMPPVRPTRLSSVRNFDVTDGS